MVKTVKNLPAMQEIQVQSLDQEESLREEMATHSSILAWRVPWTEEPGRLQPMGSHRVRCDFHFLFFFQPEKRKLKVSHLVMAYSL